ncbi:MAG: CopD family protein [Terriglobia bacterium]
MGTPIILCLLEAAAIGFQYTPWDLMFHIAGLVFWIGGLLIATNLFAQAARQDEPAGRAALCGAASRLLRTMAIPGAALMIITGFLLIATNAPYYMHAGWMHVKLLLVLILIVLTAVASAKAPGFAAGKTQVSKKYWLNLHMATALVFIGILICVLPGRML